MKRVEKSGKEEYDLIVVGGGVSGLAAAMYAGRLELKTLCLGKSSGSELPLGGVITTTNLVENYPGFEKISGVELATKIREHAKSYPLVTLKEENAEGVERKGDLFCVTSQSKKYLSKTVIFATGTKWRKLDVPGGKEFENKGVAYCALCDAPLFKNKIVGLIGGSDSAAKDALVLAEHAKKVYIIYRGEKIHPEPINLKRIEEKKNIEIIKNANVLEVRGNKKIERVLLDRSYNGSEELVLDGLFVAIGHVAISEIAGKLGVALNEKGEIIINHKTSATNISGVYAAGDVTDRPFKQAITGVAEGCVAAYSAFEYIKGRL